MNIWQGQRVRLRAVEPSDWNIHFEWDQDTEMSRALHEVWFPRSREKARQWAEETALQGPTDDKFSFQIETLAGEMVGHISTHDCDIRNGTFSYGVAVHPDHQRKGYATEAITLVLRFYFDERRYQKVNAGIYSFNEGSIRLHERLGFALEGRLRRMVYTRGLFYDLLIFGMTAEEFAERYTNE